MWLFYFLFVYFIFLSKIISVKCIEYSSLDKQSLKVYSLVYLLLTMGLLMLLTCLRRIDVGNDTYSYSVIFSNVLTYGTSVNNEIELGFKYFLEYIGMITNEYQIVIIIVGIISYFCVMNFIRKFSYNVAFSTILFFFIFYKNYINASRQVLAISLILFGISYLYRKKYFWFILLNLVGISMHVSALAGLLFPFLYNIKYKKKIAFIIIAVFTALSMSDNLLIDLYFASGFGEKYLLEDSSLSSLFNFIISALLFIVQQILSNNIDDNLPDVEKSRLNFYSWMALIGFCCSIIGFRVWIMQRFFMYFGIFYIVSLPNLMLYSKTNKTIRSLFKIIIMAMLVMYHTGIYVMRPDWTTEFPYYFFFEK